MRAGPATRSPSTTCTGAAAERTRTRRAARRAPAWRPARRPAERGVERRRRARPRRPRRRPTARPARSAARRTSPRAVGVSLARGPSVRPGQVLGCRAMPIPTGDRPFDPLAAELVADQCAANPILGSVLGLTEYDESLPDLSADGVAAARARRGRLGRPAARPRPTADLSDDERIDRDLALMVLRGRALMRDWADWRRSPDHYAGTALSARCSCCCTHRLRREPELAQAVAARLRGTPALLEQGIDNLDPALAHPALLRRALGQIGAGAAYARSVADEFTDEASAALVRAAGERGGRGLRAVRRARPSPSSTRPAATGRSARRATTRCSREAEGLGYGTRALRDKGQAAYDELAADMTRARPGAARHTTTSSPWSRASTRTTPRRRRRCSRSTARRPTRRAAFCVEHDLVTMPEGEQCEVVPSAPFSRAMLAVAHYMQPPPFAPPGDDAPASATSSCPTRRTARPRSRSTRGWRPTTTTAPGRSRCTRPTPATTGTSPGCRANAARRRVATAALRARLDLLRRGLGPLHRGPAARAGLLPDRRSRSCASATSGCSGPPGSSSTPRCTSAR